MKAMLHDDKSSKKRERGLSFYDEGWIVENSMPSFMDGP